jgi:hypothetical protein
MGSKRHLRFSVITIPDRIHPSQMYYRVCDHELHNHVYTKVKSAVYDSVEMCTYWHTAPVIENKIKVGMGELH